MCDVTKIEICELMGFIEIIREIKTKFCNLGKNQNFGCKLSATYYHSYAPMTPYKSYGLVHNVRNQANFYKDLYEVIRAKPCQYLITDWWHYAKFQHGGIFDLDLSEYYSQTSDFTNEHFMTSSLRYSIAYF